MQALCTTIGIGGAHRGRTGRVEPTAARANAALHQFRAPQALCTLHRAICAPCSPCARCIGPIAPAAQGRWAGGAHWPCAHLLLPWPLPLSPPLAMPLPRPLPQLLPRPVTLTTPPSALALPLPLAVPFVGPVRRGGGGFVPPPLLRGYPPKKSCTPVPGNFFYLPPCPVRVA